MCCITNVCIHDYCLYFEFVVIFYLKQSSQVFFSKLKDYKNAISLYLIIRKPYGKWKQIKRLNVKFAEREITAIKVVLARSHQN